MLSRTLRTIAPVQRSRFIHASPTVLNRSQHNPDTYSKDVDETPPPDSSIYRVDPDSENVQKPHEPPSGEWSRAGVNTEEYRNVNKSDPYSTNPAKDMRYGGKREWASDKGPETSKPSDGPEGKEKHGRKA